MPFGRDFAILISCGRYFGELNAFRGGVDWLPRFPPQAVLGERSSERQLGERELASCSPFLTPAVSVGSSVAAGGQPRGCRG